LPTIILNPFVFERVSDYQIEVVIHRSFKQFKPTFKLTKTTRKQEY